MTNHEAKQIIIKERDSLKANPEVTVEECLYEAFHMAIQALEQEPCDNVISREDVIALIQCSEYELQDRVDNDAMCDDVRGLPSVTQKSGEWISVSERLPEKNMPCLVSAGKLCLTQIAVYSDLMGTIDHRIFYQGDYGHENFVDITQYVKAWMPLPKPYEPQES